MGKPSGIRTARKHVKNRRSQVRRCKEFKIFRPDLIWSTYYLQPFHAIHISAVVYFTYK